MNKQILITLFLTLFILIATKPVESATFVAGNSASLNKEFSLNSNYRDIKIATVKSVLTKYNSDLTDQSPHFVDAAYKYDLDPYLLVSISGLESYFGRFMIPGTHNGFGWGSGTIYFDNWQDSIYTISQKLRTNYYDKGAVTVDDVGRKYAESKTWSVRVKYFMTVFKQEENKIKNSYNIINI